MNATALNAFFKNQLKLSPGNPELSEFATLSVKNAMPNARVIGMKSTKTSTRTAARPAIGGKAMDLIYRMEV
jgi:hypothetical protein